MHSIRAELHIALTARGLFIALPAEVFVLCIGIFSVAFGLLQSGNPLFPNQHQQLLLEALSSNAMLLCAPILCALPYAPAFIDEYKSGFVKHCLPRMRLREYIEGKAIACAVSGGLTLNFGIMLAYLLFALVFTPMELAPSADMPAHSMILPILSGCVRFFLNGALWALFGMCMSAITMNKYMAFASPFIFFYILVILAERYFRDLYILNPKNWLTGNGNWPGGNWGLTSFLIIWIGVIAIAFCYVAERRLTNA